MRGPKLVFRFYPVNTEKSTSVFQERENRILRRAAESEVGKADPEAIEKKILEIQKHYSESEDNGYGSNKQMLRALNGRLPSRHPLRSNEVHSELVAEEEQENFPRSSSKCFFTTFPGLDGPLEVQKLELPDQARGARRVAQPKRAARQEARLILAEGYCVFPVGNIRGTLRFLPRVIQCLPHAVGPINWAHHTYGVTSLSANQCQRQLYAYLMNLLRELKFDDKANELGNLENSYDHLRHYRDAILLQDPSRFDQTSRNIAAFKLFFDFAAHLPMLDYDEKLSLETLGSRVRALQQEFGLGIGRIYETRRGHHVYFPNDRVSIGLFRKILEHSGCDPDFLASVNQRLFATLRVGPKLSREPDIFWVMDIQSENPLRIEPVSVTGNVIHELIQTSYREPKELAIRSQRQVLYDRDGFDKLVDDLEKATVAPAEVPQKNTDLQHLAPNPALRRIYQQNGESKVLCPEG